MSTDRILRLGLIALGGYAAFIGAWAFLAPGSFYEHIAKYGGQNAHFLGDLGSFSIAFGLALIAAAWRPAWRVPLLVVGTGWYGLHALNHFLDAGDARSTARGLSDAVALLLGALAHAALGRVAAARPSTGLSRGATRRLNKDFA